MKQGKKEKTKSEEEEGIRKLEDAVEEVEEEVYHDAVDKERGTRERSKDKGKKGDGESENAVIEQIEVNPQKQNETRIECNYYAILDQRTEIKTRLPMNRRVGQRSDKN